MGLAEFSENEEEAGPNEDEEKDGEESDGVEGGEARGEKVLPVAAGGGGEEVVLDEDYDAGGLLAIVK